MKNKTKIEQTMKELSELYEFFKKIPKLDERGKTYNPKQKE